MLSDEDLRLWIKPVEDEEIETLRRLEKAAIAHIQKKTGRYFGPVAVVTEYLNWRGWPMQLANVPLSLTTFKSWSGSAWTTVDATSYYLQGSFIFWNSRTAPAWSPLTMPTRYEVVYQAGYAQLEDPNATAAPDDVQQAVLLLVGHWYENREAVVVGDSATDELPLAVSALLDGHVKVAV